MAHKREIRWLQHQLPEWVEKGLISEVQAERLRRHYDEAGDGSGYQLGVIALGVLGALLIGGGIILIVAYNWEDMTKAWRTVFSFVPVVMGLAQFAYAYFRRQDSLAWREASSGWLMLMLAATISLITQTYHLAGTMESYLRLWLLLSIPLLYLLNSSFAALIYVYGITVWAFEAGRPDSAGYWAFFAAALPHLWWNLRRTEQPIRRQLLAWAFMISWAFGWFATVETSLYEYGFLGSAIWLSGFFLLNDTLFPGGKSLLRQPLAFFGLGGVLVMLLIAGFDMRIPELDLRVLWLGKNLPVWATRINFLVFLCLLGLWIWETIQVFRQAKDTPEMILMAGFPVFALVYLMLGQGDMDSALAIILANLYGIAIGVAYLREGVRQNNLLNLNLGMLFIIALALSRFFDADWSMITKGIAFVALGMGFLFGNWYIARKKDITH